MGFQKSKEKSVCGRVLISVTVRNGAKGSNGAGPALSDSVIDRDKQASKINERCLSFGKGKVFPVKLFPC